MAVRKIEGWEYYPDTTTLQSQGGWAWDQNYSDRLYINNSGRFGTLGMHLSSGWYGQNALWQNFGDSQPTWVIGSAVNITNYLSYSHIFTIRDGGTIQVELRIDPLGHVWVSRAGGTWLGQSTGTFLRNTWNYFEMKVTIHPSAGSIEVKGNGQTVISLSGINTSASGNAYANRIEICRAGGDYSEIYFDDTYILDGTGSAPWNTFLGDCRVQTLVPTGAGNYTEWTPSAGSNWQNVDEVQANGTDYNYTTTALAKDTFAISDLSVASGTVYAVVYRVVAMKDDAGTRTLTPLARINGADYPGTTVSLPSSYAFIEEIHETNPDTGVSWTITNVNALELGYRLES